MSRLFTTPTSRLVCWTVAGAGALLFLAPCPAAAQPPSSAETPAAEPGTGQAGQKGILDLDVEQLSKVDVLVPSMDVEVTSVAKQESTVGRSPAAVFVITQEMVRRSGATSIPEVLRMVPGLDVARINSNSWAVASRGFNDLYANKLLVLIDGRSVYTPLFSGVDWDTQDVLLEDIERIEVVRGPGGTLWGANAVNGVINVITKQAKDTQGLLVTSGGGSEDLTISGVRYGGQNDQGLSWRAYGKHFERGPGFDPAGAADDWRVGRGGFRVDWEADPWKCNTFTVQGDYYGGNEGKTRVQPIPTPPFSRRVVDDEDLAGAYVLTRWTHTFDEDSDWELQAYFDQLYRAYDLLREDLTTFDVEFQHRFPLGERQQLIWGVGCRQNRFGLAPDGYVLDYIPPKQTKGLFSVFVQDEIKLIEDRLYFTVGSKFEQNDYTGFEYQPSGRLLWTPDRKHSAWGAISRAVRTPSYFDFYGRMTLPRQTVTGVPFPVFPRLTGNPLFRSEDLLAYEIGYRTQASKRFAWDLATFLNVYEHVQTASLGVPFIDPYGNVVAPFPINNEIRGQTYGAEVVGYWTMSDTWQFSASYTFLEIQMHRFPSSTYVQEELIEGGSPHNQVCFRSSWDLSNDWEFDLGLRYVDSLPTLQVPDYITMDIRLAWVPSESFELAIVAQNLLDTHHLEYGAHRYNILASNTEVQRGVFAKATWRY